LPESTKPWTSKSFCHSHNSRTDCRALYFSQRCPHGRILAVSLVIGQSQGAVPVPLHTQDHAHARARLAVVLQTATADAMTGVRRAVIQEAEATAEALVGGELEASPAVPAYHEARRHVLTKLTCN
jgi:hypothetical protein